MSRRNYLFMFSWPKEEEEESWISSQVTFIEIALYTIQIISKQLYSVKQENSLAIMQENTKKQTFFFS